MARLAFLLLQLDYGYPDSGCTISLLNVDDDLLARAKAGEFDKEP